MALTADGYHQVSAATACVLNSAYAALNRTTNGLLGSLGVYRFAGRSTLTSMDDLVDQDVGVITDAIETANDAIGATTTADDALATIDGYLSRMADLAGAVVYGTLSEARVAARGAEYQTLAGQVAALLSDTAYDGTPVLSGADAEVTLDLADVTGMALTAMPDGAMASLATAITDVGLARGELAAETATLTETVTGLQDQSSQLAALSARVATTTEALGVLRSTTHLIVTQITAALTAQGAYLSSQIDNLVGVNFLG